MNRYEEKLEARKERLEARARKARAESASREKTARTIMDGIPLGQPILVGHHSERRARKDRERIHTNLKKAWDAAERAAYYERVAASIGTHGISSDDPDAITKLRAQLDDLAECRKIELAVNSQLRKASATKEKALGRKLTPSEHIELVEALTDIPASIKKQLASYARAFPWLPQFAGHTNANALRIKKRITELEARAAAPERVPTTTTVDGVQVKIEENREANRVQIFFPGKPSDERRAALKARGFRWSPTEGAWQRQASDGAWYDAHAVCGVTHETIVALMKAPAKEPTLGETLARLGLTYRSANDFGAKHILRSETILFTGTAGEVWKWLRANGLLDADPDKHACPDGAACADPECVAENARRSK